MASLQETGRKAGFAVTAVTEERNGSAFHSNNGCMQWLNPLFDQGKGQNLP
jgi:hypothetical protein